MSRQKITIDELVDRIYGIADLLCLLAELDEDTPIKPRTVACAGKIIAHDIMHLSCYLADNPISGANPEKEVRQGGSAASGLQPLRVFRCRILSPSLSDHPQTPSRGVHGMWLSHFLQAMGGGLRHQMPPLRSHKMHSCLMREQAWYGCRRIET